MAVPVEQWIAVRRLLDQSRGALSLLAAQRYPASRLVPGSPFLALSVPSSPVPAADLRLSWAASPPFSVPAPDFLPFGFVTYSAAIASVEPVENRSCYRLLTVAGPQLTFGPGSLFDRLDTAEALAHEFCGGGTAFRDRLGDPFDLCGRSVIPDVQTLLVSRDGYFAPPTGQLPPAGADLPHLFDGSSFYLGVGLDPLPLSASILTVSVVDSLPDAAPFTPDAVSRFLRSEPVTPAGAAVLALALRHAALLL
ncbi:hypothetical protein [Kutzneria chonburiensis]|uniref:Uncharacterized protein n=1 Tax=Kutzneria chonburiensis TaxID=1483604 RepID=A0ABV6MSB3_9PSEU|nr:hypothetical protein [Kutzneria chonburiensis]